MADQINIDKFLSLSQLFPVIDVRSPSEFNQGHIPGAVNIPLFDDNERKLVGTIYKKVNREAAIFKGLDLAGKKLAELAREGERTAGKSKTVLVHCWRGGMRSKSMVWLFETIGLDCSLLEGGYKSYRRHVKEQFSIPLILNVIGGRTGSGKTEILHYLQKKDEQVIDLEGLANHKGSAFGALGESEQPTTEQFENNLAEQLSGVDPEKRIWIEDESMNVGKCVIPAELYSRMRENEIVFLDIPREMRAGHLVKNYANYGNEELKSCVNKITRKLGGDRTKEALDSIDRGDFYQTAMITLHYYDKAYMHSLEKNHDKFRVIKSGSVDPVINASRLLKHYGR